MSRTASFPLRRLPVLTVLGHSKADTTVNVYMQPIDESVKQAQEAIYAELTARPEPVRIS